MREENSYYSWKLSLVKGGNIDDEAFSGIVFGLGNPDFSLPIFRFLSSETKMIILFASFESVASASTYRIHVRGPVIPRMVEI